MCFIFAYKTRNRCIYCLGCVYNEDIDLVRYTSDLICQVPYWWHLFWTFIIKTDSYSGSVTIAEIQVYGQNLDGKVFNSCLNWLDKELLPVTTVLALSILCFTYFAVLFVVCCIFSVISLRTVAFSSSVQLL